MDNYRETLHLSYGGNWTVQVYPTRRFVEAYLSVLPIVTTTAVTGVLFALLALFRRVLGT